MTPEAGLQVGTDLLLVGTSTLPKKKGQREGVGMLEFAVHRETAPFLISTTRSMTWVTPRGDRLLAGIRPLPDLGSLFREVVLHVVEKGRLCEWGSIHPSTPAGLLEAIAHVRSYGIQEVDLLVHPLALKGLPSPVEHEHGRSLLGLPLEEAPWLPEGVAVVVPSDRGFLGFVLYTGPGQGVFVVHNASRGMAAVAP